MQADEEGRHSSVAAAALPPEALTIDANAREARLRGELLDLTKLEFDLLSYLAVHPGWVVSPEELYEQVWGYSWGSDRRLVSVHVGNLRRKLRESGSHPGLIQPVRGAGYKLVLPEGSPKQMENPDSSFRLPGHALIVHSLPRRNPTARIPLLERETEQALLAEALERSAAGRGGIVLVLGEAGSGKTRLIEDLAASASAEEGAPLTLWGRCLDDSGAPAYWPWLQVLRRLRDALGPEQLLHLAGPDREALLQLLPELRPPDCPSPFHELLGDPFLLFQAVSRLIVRASAARPYVLALDDLQWAEQESLRLLQVLALEVATSRILVLATWRIRDVPRGHQLDRIMPALLRAGAQQIELSGLAHKAVETLVRAAAGTEAEPELIEAVAAKTRGNPLHICELVRLVRAAQPLAERLALLGELPLPRTIQQVVARRVSS
ncbi:MAG: hypothetical protein FIA95_07420, partial [Gemmatimonadetes bacterium]|nr:hypothetical protein [Gemmatimonadota bacterium]